MAWESSRQKQEREEAEKRMFFAGAVLILVVFAYCVAAALEPKMPSTESLDQIATELYQQSSKFAQGR